MDSFNESANASFAVKKAVVIGAGPVGCLCAIALSKLGWAVDVYEARADIRLPAVKAKNQQRSINLAISSRGIAALQTVLGVSKTTQFLESVIPMRGRMIHSVDGELDSQAYDTHGQCINSIDRALLNEYLLTEAISVPTIRVFFQHKITALDFDAKKLTVHDSDAGEDCDREVNFDLCVGADGSYSVVRRQMMRVVRMDYQQEYIQHEYIELRIPADNDARGKAAFALDPNHLHIWPRHSFMLIALPNKDMSFTSTLFAPTADFDRLAACRPKERLAWFRKQFPDAVPLIGEQALLAALENNPRSPLISIKADPYHYKDAVIILGDAAHSMVPFYGQGLNCGLEDVRVLYSLLGGSKEAALSPTAAPSTHSFEVGPEPGEKHHEALGHVARVLSQYSETRHRDLLAICDLAMDNYVEMRHSVTTPAYLFRKKLDNILTWLAGSGRSSGDVAAHFGSSASSNPFAPPPLGWLPLYTMVTFRPDISYDAARRKHRRQSQIVVSVGWALTGLSTLGLGWALLAGYTYAQRWKLLRHHSS